MLSDLKASYQRDHLLLLLEGCSEFKEKFYSALWGFLVKEMHFSFVLRLASYHIALSWGVPFCVEATIPIPRRQIRKINNPSWLPL